ncbi:riboflavin biosynthesis protein RibF [Boudabousia liubingyangii]|uniref:Riboflavin biosynthesis protein n=1 Tax=Boudabousia liubingyangii TaxID=1921764 RepID=A0A1Q5PNP8_9ACTO|nr:bifunctional riboflavin kinase/FAD synthetase [Boudabousia liubingyangii]OKL47792.1 riboflavin biosynthesis protein RibF [Boudabousia liubingyangii]OKL49176.1 riboflavin biosynthesis protein RibF [Boudabousia liubingyangii]
MEIVRQRKELPAGLKSVATIGIFDGLHRGHRELISELIRVAKAENVPAWVITFDPHPAHLHAPEKNLRLITSLTDRLSGMEALGVDGVLVEPYNWDLAGMTAEEFVKDYFVEGLGVKAVVVGQDVRFGVNNSGNLETLKELGERYGFAVQVLEEQCSKAGRRYSSTWVRDALAEGNVEQVAHVLGSYHRVRGQVVHGHKRGRALGFPTANLDAEMVGEVPGDGVYAGWLERRVPGSNAVERLAAAISVGTNPHFEGQKRTVEAHVLGRADLNLYGSEVAVDFVKKLRPMLVFNSLDELLAQMDEDLRQAAQILSVPVAGRVDPAAVTA